MKIKKDEGGNPYIVCGGKNGMSVSVKMDAATRDIFFYMIKPAKGVNIGKLKTSTIFKSDGDLVLVFALGELAAYTIADAIIVLRNWEPENDETPA